MYHDYYKLTDRPFQLTPDPRFYFESGTHKKAMAYLSYGLMQGEGFIIVTGEIGAGKTMLSGHLIDQIDPARVLAVKLVSTNVEGDDVLRLVAQSFGITTDAAPKAQLLDRIEHYLQARVREGRKILLIVDEAQNLAIDALEELRMLSNFQIGNRALLQIFLLGQPEFRDKLASPALEQLRQRVIATHHLLPMEPQEVGPYIEHRLKLVGWAGQPHFTPDAYAALKDASGGLPRKLNNLTERALLMAGLEQRATIDALLVQAMLADQARDERSPEAASAPLTAEAQPAKPQPAEPQPAKTHSNHDSVTLDLAARLAAIEAQSVEHDAALRRVLTLLIDWVEQQPNAATGATLQAPVA